MKISKKIKELICCRVFRLMLVYKIIIMFAVTTVITPIWLKNTYKKELCSMYNEASTA